MTFFPFHDLPNVVTAQGRAASIWSAVAQEMFFWYWKRDDGGGGGGGSGDHGSNDDERGSLQS